MVTSLEGTYRNGQIELAETPAGIPTQTKVIVTFIQPASVDLKSYGINREQAAELRARLSGLCEDWDAPGMGVYDDCDLQKGAGTAPNS